MVVSRADSFAGYRRPRTAGVCVPLSERPPFIPGQRYFPAPGAKGPQLEDDISVGRILQADPVQRESFLHDTGDG